MRVSCSFIEQDTYDNLLKKEGEITAMKMMYDELISRKPLAAGREEVERNLQELG